MCGNAPRGSRDTNLIQKNKKVKKVTSFPLSIAQKRTNRANRGKLNAINFIQINTNKAKRATDDLVLFAKKFTSPIILAQEPYANGKNIIPNPTADLRVMAKPSATERPRACIYYHKCLQDKLWFMDTLTTKDCTTIQTSIDNTPSLFVSCYMDRLDPDCPPQAFKKAVEHARKHNMAFIAGTDANAHNTLWSSTTMDKKGTDRGNSLLEYIAREKLMVENVGDTPTFDNGRWKNVIDLTITNKKGHELLKQWQVAVKEEDENSSDHHFITYNIKSKTGLSKSKFRDITKTDWPTYQKELAQVMEDTADKFHSLNTPDDIDAAAQQLADNVKGAFDAATEEVYVSNKVRAPPWETPAVREAKAGIKHRLRGNRGTKSDKEWSELRSHQAEYNRLVNHTKKVKFKEFCQGLESKSNPKRISNLIKNNKTVNLGTIRKPNGDLTESPKETLEIMTDTHFAAPDPEPADPPRDQAAECGTANKGAKKKSKETDPDLIFSPRRLKRSVAEFDPLSAAGPDAIRPIMLQRGWDAINTAFANIAKASYTTGHTPACWSKSTGIFLPKPGKSDYYNPKSYRTITLTPVPLKWMERLILWHMEVDLKIQTKLNKKQYGFVKGSSTETALHKLVNKIENAILNQGMALGTFLDIEGAFDNITFNAIERALTKKCESSTVNNWIMSMIKDRCITVELHGNKKTIKIKRGCPQGGILSPFLWNLVVDSLLSYTRNKIPCDLQGFADDLSLMATLNSPRISGGKGFDEDTLREITQKSLQSINGWCKENGLKLSSLKSHSVMFTWRRKWSFSKPLRVDGNDIEMKESTKLLGITLDNKLSWNEHIIKQCKKAKGILMQCRRAVGPTWGFTPKTMKWIYTAVVRPSLAYGATIWINGLKTKRNRNLLTSVQRLGNILITGAMPSTASSALDKITGLVPIENWLEEEAAKGALRLKISGHWEQAPMINSKGNLTSHIKLNNEILKSVPILNEEQDAITSQLSIDNNFTVDIPQRDLYEELPVDVTTINCYTDGSKIEEDVGAAVYITHNKETKHEESTHLGKNSTVFQAETYAVGQAATLLLQAGTNNQNIVINCDSQSAIEAINSTKIKSKTTLKTNNALNTLGENNQVLLRWVPAHQGYEGNEKADALAKKGSKNIDSNSISLPIPKVIGHSALRKRTMKKMGRSWNQLPSSHMKIMWRDKFMKEIPKLNRGNLRRATQFLTGHAALNYHLNKFKPDKISPTCPHCLAEDETVGHFIGRCPKWSAQRSALFDSFYLSASDIVDGYTLTEILHFINDTRRLADNHSQTQGA